MGLTWQSYPPERLLKERFHISTGFHAGQREIIEQLVQGKRVLAIQRTGWGKSLCYQVASLYYPYLLYDAEDATIQEHYIDTSKPEKKTYEAILTLLNRYPQGLQRDDILWETGFSSEAVRTVLADLEEQHFIKYNAKAYTYSAFKRHEQLDLSANETVRLQKLQELHDIENYALGEACYMHYLTSYLGDEVDQPCGSCGYCQKDNFPFIMPAERIQLAAIHFLNEDFMPYIERYSIRERSGQLESTLHEAGWSLSYYSKSSIGAMVRASKYQDAGPFALSLVYRAVEVIRARYPVHLLDGIVSVPPTKSGLLVETFARQVADMLGLAYLPVLGKVQQTREQKELTNRVQKTRNIQGAFSVRSPELVVGRTLLLLDDIYDSGSVIREVGKTLLLAGVKAVYPLTITRTQHANK